MAKLYGRMTGDNSKKVTRQGHHELTAHISGWDIGIAVDCIAKDNGDDELTVYITKGSNGESGDSSRDLLATVTQKRSTRDTPAGPIRLAIDPASVM